MSKHTPGPWAVEELKHRYRLRCSIEATDGSLVGESYEEKNAHLIAAAPELLDALCYLLEASSGQGPHEQWLAAMDQARAAIAKAEGERMVRPSPQEPDSFTVEAARAAIAKALGE